MLKLFTLLLAFAIPTVIALGSTLSWDTTEIRIELKPDQEEARAEFTVTNNGDEAIRIAQIKTSCGCTGSMLQKKILQPGESSTVIGTFNKGKRQGLNHNKLEVYLDGQSEPAATLHMIVQIPKLIETVPSLVYWNKDTSNTVRTIKLTLDQRYLDEITSIKYNHEQLSLVEEEDPSGKATLILKILPKSFDSVLRETITIDAKGKDGMTGTARAYIFVQP